MPGNNVTDERAFRKCSVEGCERKHFGRGYCNTHLMQVRRRGGIDCGGTTPGSLPKFIHEVAMKHEGDECLIWPYGRNKDGYGHLQANGKRHIASRYVCELVHGPASWPAYEAAHSCGNGHLGCVSPSHLSWKTPEENRLDKTIHRTVRGAAAAALLGASQ